MQNNLNGHRGLGYFCSYLPKELLHAFGFIPYRVLPEEGESAVTEAYLPQNYCALLKATFAPFLRGQGPALQAVVFLDSCDGYRRLHDLWLEYSSTSVLAFLDLPRRNDPLGKSYYAGALRVLVRRLAEWTGRPLTAEMLSQSIAVYNEQRRLFAGLAKRRAAGFLSDADYHRLRRQLLQEDPQVVNEEMTRRLAGPLPDARPLTGTRVMLLGSVVIKPGLIDVIGEAGARVVAEDSCVDQREQTREVRTGGSLEELIDDLAATYLEKPACPRMRQVADRLSYLNGLIAEHQVDGLICSYHKFCDVFLGEYPILKTAMERQGIPTLLIEDDGEAALSGQVRTRLEAFLEVLGC